MCNLIYVVYDSLTGQTEKFAKNTSPSAISISEYTKIPKGSKVLLCTRSFGFGKIPESTEEYIKSGFHNIIGTAVSGNKNWGPMYGKAADLIEEEYNIPCVLKFEASGLPSDVEKVKRYLSERIAS